MFAPAEILLDLLVLLRLDTFRVSVFRFSWELSFPSLSTAAIVAPLIVVSWVVSIFTVLPVRVVRSVSLESLELLETLPPIPVGVNPLVLRFTLFEFELLEVVFWTEDTSRFLVLSVSVSSA
jgi:hypothetical protein